MIMFSTQPVTIEATSVTQNGLPVVLIDGELFTVEDLE